MTDRRRLAASVGAPPSEYLDVLSEQIAAAAAAGVDFVQIREPDLEARPLTAFVRSVAAKLRGSKTRILVNDRLDVALAAGADGVHLKESSVAPELARSLAPKDFVVACAVHTALTAAARRSADFIVAGTVLPTVSKVRADYLEWRGLAEVIGAANGTPVVGIGGLDLASIPSLARTGAAGLAAIGAFIPTTGKLGIEEFMKKRVSDMRFAFDSAQSRP
ncbi:MAG TPA: thiamine phosphate synthase [Vicinamibacterales bacterium]